MNQQPDNSASENLTLSIKNDEDERFVKEGSQVLQNAQVISLSNTQDPQCPQAPIQLEILPFKPSQRFEEEKVSTFQENGADSATLVKRLK